MVFRSAPEKTAAKQFRKLPAEQRSIVFYAEGRGDWAHIGPLVDGLLELDRPVTYLTSEDDDPILERDDARLVALPIGDGAVRTMLFRDLDAGLLVTTVPDLDTYSLKRSLRPVHYVYVFHAFVSTHMVYRPKAFDAFDTIFCVGPHHAREIRATEARDDLPKKRLVKHGYGRLDEVRRTATPPPAPDPARPPRVLVAGSWGDDALMETRVGHTLVAELLADGCEVVVRLHPMTQRHHPGLPDELVQAFPGGGLRVETDLRTSDSLNWSDVMISDWSGAAFDYAFGLERPVVFIDTPRKVNNADYESLGIEPIEVTLREQIGAVVGPEALGTVASVVRDVAGDPNARPRLAELRQDWVYNPDRSGSVGAGWLAAAADALAG